MTENKHQQLCNWKEGDSCEEESWCYAWDYNKNEYTLHQTGPPDGFDNIHVFKELRQAVGHVREFGSSIYKSCYCNNDTETWKI